MLEPLSWHGEAVGNCRRCDTDFEFVGFPALTATRVRVAPKAVLAAEHATCFFHAENQAEAVCSSCGRFLCGVCALDFNQQKFCPGCIASANNTPVAAVPQRTLYGGIALVLAVVPLLILPFTIATAPIALGFVIYGWRKPGSLVATGRSRLIVAGVIAALEIIGWLFVLFAWLNKNR
ncbi:MAG: hypothetical protein ABIY47_20855 [Opitutaceae bacterium]